jgi:hypothetical protein
MSWCLTRSRITVDGPDWKALLNDGEALSTVGDASPHIGGSSSRKSIDTCSLTGDRVSKQRLR